MRNSCIDSSTINISIANELLAHYFLNLPCNIIFNSMQQPSSLENFWNLSKEDALRFLSVTDKGLSSNIATVRQKQYGPNTFKPRSKTSSVLLFLLQFKSPITLLLIAAALLSMG